MRSARAAVLSRCATSKVVRRGRELLGRPDHGGLGGQVERRRRLVEQQDRRVDQVGAGQRDQLTLPGGQVAAALGDLVANPPGSREIISIAPTPRAAASTSASVASGRP